MNAVPQSGIVQWPVSRYSPDGKPGSRFALYREAQNPDGQTFPLSIPVCTVGTTCGTPGE